MNRGPKRKKGNGTGYSGNENDAAIVTQAMHNAQQKQKLDDEKTRAYLLQVKETISSAPAATCTSNTMSTCIINFEILQDFLSPGNNKRRQRIQETLKNVFRSITPSEWDSPVKCQVVHAALDVCHAMADHVELSLAMFPSKDQEGDEDDDNNNDASCGSSLLDLINSSSKQAKMIAARSALMPMSSTQSGLLDDMQVAM